MTQTTIAIKRVYEPPSPDDGFRILVDRLWPRGESKEKAHLDLWDKDTAPSTELRQWFGHDPAKFAEFARKYRAELAANPALAELKKVVAAHPKVTLLYGAHDEADNNAVVLREVLLGR